MNLQPVNHVLIDCEGEGIRSLKNHADFFSQFDDIDIVKRVVVDENITFMRTSSMRSFMRLKQRSSVDLPQPEGPMSAVMALEYTLKSISLSP